MSDEQSKHKKASFRFQSITMLFGLHPNTLNFSPRQLRTFQRKSEKTKEEKSLRKRIENGKEKEGGGESERGVAQ